LRRRRPALCYSIVLNHPFVDGNKRVGHAAMETFLVLNHREIKTDVGESERLMLDIAAGRCSRERLVAWLQQHVITL
jgi:death-on-curing protein